jgi:hypothetical protein
MDVAECARRSLGLVLAAGALDVSVLVVARGIVFMKVALWLYTIKFTTASSK